MKPAYKFVNVNDVTGELGGHGPRIIKAAVEDVTATDWRTAKKSLRKFYLDRAAELRKITEKDYFAQPND